MRRLWTLAMLATLLVSGSAVADCHLGVLVQLPVTMVGLRPTIPVRINGAAAVFAIDSGSFFGILTPATAGQFRLPLSPAPERLRINGLGGAVNYSVARVARFGLGRLNLTDMDFVVGGNQLGGAVQGLLGANVLDDSDVEYDFANGVVRLLRPDGCRRANLAYWDRSRAYSVVDLAPTGPLSAPQTTAYLNGKRIEVAFDTGSPLSLLSLRAARRAGFSIHAPGVVPGGYSYGLGRAVLPTWIAHFASFRLGGEEIRNTRLRVADLGSAPVDMLIGADFFLAHHLYVANSQRRLYFTYNGGPVFSLAPYEPPALARGAPAAPPPPAPALADFDRALQRSPNDVPALMARARLRLQRGDAAGAASDAQALDRVLAPQADERLQLGQLYLTLAQYAPAVQQYDEWLAAHRDDFFAPVALYGRGTAEMREGQGAAGAADIHRAIRLRPDVATQFAHMGAVP